MQADGVTFVLGRLHPEELLEFMKGMHDYIRVERKMKVGIGVVDVTAIMPGLFGCSERWLMLSLRVCRM